jgi:monoamine oxidase
MSDPVDCIVVGAGLAGLACAGELVRSDATMASENVRRRAWAAPSLVNAQDTRAPNQSQSPTVCSRRASDAIARSFSMARV